MMSQRSSDSEGSNALILDLSRLHGEGLIATRTIEPGTMLISEKPMIQLTLSENDTGAPSAEEVWRKVKKLTKLTKQEKDKGLKGYYDRGLQDILEAAANVSDEKFKGMELPTFKHAIRKADEETKEALKHLVQKAMFPPPSRRWRNVAYLCPRMSMLNHSCRPNAEISGDTKNGLLVLMAIETINEGDEITVSYLNVNLFREREVRHRKLGFTCECRECRKEGTEFEELEQKRKQVGDWFDRVLAFREKHGRSEQDVFTVTSQEEAELLTEDEEFWAVLKAVNDIREAAEEDFKHAGLVLA